MLHVLQLPLTPQSRTSPGGSPSLDDLLSLRTDNSPHWSFTLHLVQLLPCLSSEKALAKLSARAGSLRRHPTEPGQVKVSNNLPMLRAYVCCDRAKLPSCFSHMALVVSLRCLAPSFESPSKTFPSSVPAALAPQDITHIKMLLESLSCWDHCFELSTLTATCPLDIATGLS